VRILTGAFAGALWLLLDGSGAALALPKGADADIALLSRQSHWASHYTLPGAAAQDAPRPTPGPDRAGLRRDTAWVLSYQLVTIGILYTLPESISNWSDEQKDEYSLGKWWENVRNPQWDDDKFWINYLAHPYWGAAYYVRARERGFDERASFWYSTLMSTAYEFGAEALFEQPSIQDLVVTPVGGVILGEYFMALRARTLARYAPGEPMRFGDRALLALTDPLGAINRQVQGWLGVHGEANLVPWLGTQRIGIAPPYAVDRAATDPVYGLRLHYRW
jgi:hypothetical protein